MPREMRNRSEAVVEKPVARGSRDHSYTRTVEKSKVAVPPTNPNTENKSECKGCQKNFDKQKRMECGFCENGYCQPCSSLSKSTFDAIYSCGSASWYCNHCIHAIPGVQRLLVRMGNVETDVESLKERVETLEKRELVSNDQIKGLVTEEMAERKEVETRRLNLVCLNLPESRKDDPKDRQEEDHDFLFNVLENKMNLDMGAIEISKVVRLGKREAGQTKRRPIRFTVNQFDHKRQILKANNLLRKSEDVVYSNIYFTPDLTKNQRKHAYELRVERRSRENNGERDLKISRGKIVTVGKETNKDESRREGLSEWGTASGGGP